MLLSAHLASRPAVSLYAAMHVVALQVVVGVDTCTGQPVCVAHSLTPRRSPMLRSASTSFTGDSNAVGGWGQVGRPPVHWGSSTDSNTGWWTLVRQWPAVSAHRLVCAGGLVVATLLTHRCVRGGLLIAGGLVVATLLIHWW